MPREISLIDADLLKFRPIDSGSEDCSSPEKGAFAADLSAVGFFFVSLQSLEQWPVALDMSLWWLFTGPDAAIHREDEKHAAP